MANPSDVTTSPIQVETTSSEISGQLVEAPNAAGTTTSIRNISQTVQEREIIKTAPDIVVFIDGLPYLINDYVNDPKTGNQGVLVNFNDHVSSFSATYDTDAMVPNCTVGLQIPNFQKYLYQMPGGNNLLQTMAQIQVYAKGYYMAAGTHDTIYRRVFKGVTSYIGYNDNGKTLEVSVQCHGSMHLLERMQTNIHPSTISTAHTGAAQQIFDSKYSGDPFSIIAQVFLDALRSDGFQFGSLAQPDMKARSKNTDPFWQSVNRGYMSKWQAILTNMVKDVHVFGPWKDFGGFQVLTKSKVWGNKDKNQQATATRKFSPTNEAQLVAQYDTYYGNITEYMPFRNIASMDLQNSVIVNKLSILREVVGKMDFEAYQDVDGKIIIKPPVYNLDVLNLGTRTQSIWANGPKPGTGSNRNSLTNPATQIYENNNPFVVYLSEILTEQENEDQSAVRRTRTTICGNLSRTLGIGDINFAAPVGEWIDVTKLAKFGLREEPLYQVPWIAIGDVFTLFAHAVAETVRANRGYRTYTFTIPMRPELKLGFPVYIPHKDMYAYIKSISCNYNIGGTATMTVTCDSIRRRVLINTTQTLGSGNSQQTFAAYTPAPNLVYAWTKTTTTAPPTLPNQSPNSAAITQQQQNTLNSGTISGVSNSSANPSDPRGVSQSLPVASVNPDGSSGLPTPSALALYTVQTQVMASKVGNNFDTPTSTYVVKNDGDKKQGTIDPKTGHGYFCKSQTEPLSRAADYSYIKTLTGDSSRHTHSVIPFTDDKGYELISPFPWGRWIDLNTALKSFTEQGWITPPKDVKGDGTLQDLQTLKNADAFLFAGLGTPTGTGDPSSQLITALNAQSRLVGGSLTGTYPPQPSQTGTNPNNPATYASQTNDSQPDATVIVLHYDPNQPGSFADNNLLNAAQPENKFAEELLSNTQNSLQRTVDVLVSGEVAPTPAVQEALLVANTAPQQPQNVKALNTGINQPSNLNLVAEQTANFNSIKGGQ